MQTSISIHELQAEASRVIKRSEKGEVFEIMRYSKPVAVLLSVEEYRNLHQECRGCVEHWREITGKKLKKVI
jgi:prevent-host-death family protein